MIPRTSFERLAQSLETLILEFSFFLLQFRVFLLQSFWLKSVGRNQQLKTDRLPYPSKQKEELVVFPLSVYCI